MEIGRKPFADLKTWEVMFLVALMSSKRKKWKSSEGQLKLHVLALMMYITERYDLFDIPVFDVKDLEAIFNKAIGSISSSALYNALLGLTKDGYTEKTGLGTYKITTKGVYFLRNHLNKARMAADDLHEVVDNIFENESYG